MEGTKARVGSGRIGAVMRHAKSVWLVLFRRDPPRALWPALLLFILASSFTAADALATVLPEYSAADINAAPQQWQASLAKAQAVDPACPAALALNETDQDGEHAVYSVVVLSTQSKLKLAVKANGRYGIQFGFVSSDWKSFTLAAVSLVSGSYQVTESGRLRRRDIAIRSLTGDWLEMELLVEDVGIRRPGDEVSGYAIVKPTVAGGNTFYRGDAARGIMLCATEIKAP